MKKDRLLLTMTRQSRRNLEALTHACGHATEAETLEAALAWYTAIGPALRARARIFVEDVTGWQEEIEEEKVLGIA